MLSKIVKTRDYLPQILVILFRYNLSQDNLEIVPSTLSWASTRGINLIDREILGFSTTEVDHKTNSERKIIILKEEMFIGDIESVLSRIDYPVTKPTKYLRDDLKFIEHLVFHEVGHVIKRISQKDEEQADDFAFREMGLTN